MVELPRVFKKPTQQQYQRKKEGKKKHSIKIEEISETAAVMALLFGDLWPFFFNELCLQPCFTFAQGS